MMKPIFRALILLTSTLLLLSALGMIALLGIYSYFSHDLPTIDESTEFAFEVPLRVYSVEGDLIGEFGVQRRTPVKYEQIPELLVQAFVSAEDDRYFEHPGVDYQGIIRAALTLVTTGQRSQGGSTITMQLARNVFLTPEKSYERKIKEIFLALKLEREFSKEKILELYLNKIYLGNRAYGVAAAAQVYYGKELADLSTPEVAMIAGLPKAPSRFNPIANPERALQRRNYVLRRMLELGYIDVETHDQALAQLVTANLAKPSFAADAGYATEDARAEAVRLFGAEAYTLGLQVHTTISTKDQQVATAAVRQALVDYDLRHGYRGPIAQIDMTTETLPENWDEALEAYPTINDMQPALVTEVQDQSARIYLGFDEYGEIPWEGMNWAKPYRTANDWGPLPENAKQFLKVGDIVRVTRIDTPDEATEPTTAEIATDEQADTEVLADETTDQAASAPTSKQWALVQLPEAQGALVALDSETGAIRAVVGGYDYEASKFNRATQARRQPGSSFKPFLYSAALDQGYTPASIINDAPVVYESEELEGAWRPENYSGKFYGPTRLREALYKSRNLVSIRMLQGIGIGSARDYIQRFGFPRSELPSDLSLSLGSATVTPVQLARAYTVFANGGYLVEPWLVAKITNEAGEVLYQHNPVILCDSDCQAEQAAAVDAELAELEAPTISAEATTTEQSSSPDDAMSIDEAAEQAPPPRYADRTITAENWFLMNSMMRDVIQRGTATKARKLGRTDLAGKTGTTNDQKDAWFAGYSRQTVAVAWVGFDDVAPLGRGEVGGRAALPIWMEYMKTRLPQEPESPLIPPPGIVNIRISPETGERVRPGTPGAIFEVFDARFVPDELPASQGIGDTGGTGATVVEELF